MPSMSGLTGRAPDFRPAISGRGVSWQTLALYAAAAAAFAMVACIVLGIAG